MTPTLTLRDIHERLHDLRAQLFREDSGRLLVKAEPATAQQLRAEIGRLTQEARRLMADDRGTG